MMPGPGGSTLFPSATRFRSLELWKSDGTAAGTVLMDLLPGSGGSLPFSLASVDDRLFFAGNDGATGAEPWLLLDLPRFTKSFAPNPIVAGTTSTLTFIIDHHEGAADATGLAFTDDLPPAMVVADPPGAATSCTGGTLIAVPETDAITYSGGIVTAGSSCEITVDVTSDSIGLHDNLTSELTSAAGASDPASDSLTVSSECVVTTTTEGDQVIACLDDATAGCGFTDAAFVPLEDDPSSPPPDSVPPGLVFPYGLMAFTVGADCTPGFTATFIFEAPSPLPANTRYWKFGPTPDDGEPHWYPLPGAEIMGNLVAFAITDGGLGDGDLTANGSITDPGGPAVTVATVDVPTLGQSSLIVLCALLAAAALGILRRPDRCQR